MVKTSTDPHDKVIDVTISILNNREIEDYQVMKRKKVENMNPHAAGG